MASNPRVAKLREKSREIKTPVHGNLDKDKEFVFDKHKEKFYVIAKIPVRSFKVGTKRSTQVLSEMAKLFVLSEDNYEEFFVFEERYKNDSRTIYKVLHDPTVNGGKSVPVGKASKQTEPKTEA